jgi:predicted secreted protein
MAGTVSVVNTSIMGLYIDIGTAAWRTLAHSTEAGISFSHEPRDITSKASADLRTLLPGLRSWTASGSFLMAYDHATATYVNVKELFDYWKGRNKILVRFQTTNADDEYYEGYAYISSLEVSSPSAEDNVTASISLEGTGTITAT